MADETHDLIMALGIALCRAGVLDMEDIESAAKDLEKIGKLDAARFIRVMPMMAAAPTESEWNAERHRRRFRLLDGGNSD